MNSQLPELGITKKDMFIADAMGDADLMAKKHGHEFIIVRDHKSVLHILPQLSPFPMTWELVFTTGEY